MPLTVWVPLLQTVPLTVTSTFTPSALITALQDLVAVIPHVLNGTGPMKSLRVESKGAEDRVSAMNVATQLPRPRRVTLIPPSKKLPCGNEPAGPCLGTYGH